MHPAPEPVDYGQRVTAPPPDPAPSDTADAAEVVPDPAAVAGDSAAVATTVAEGTDPAGGFTVRLANFTGPFDLLLQLIGKHKLDVTEVALHQVTDEFIAYIRAMGDDWDLDEASEFLVVAATLLDLKAARLLPAAQVEDEEDLALLEARDLLFARLLQYKAFKEAAAHIAVLEAVGSRRYPRAVTLEPRYAEALPDLVLGIGPERLAALAVKAMTPKTPPTVSIDHVHQVRSVSGSTPPFCGTGCGGSGRPPSGPSVSTASRRSRWWPGSWPCWSSTGRGLSASPRCRRWGS